MRPGRRALLVVNPASRRGREALDAGTAVLEEAGFAVHQVKVEDADKVDDAVRSGAAEADLVVLAGGDGTLNCAAEALVESGLPFGLIPTGTANDLARTLGIPIDPAEACRIIVEGTRQRIDLGWVEGKLFFNVAHIGFGVAVAEQHTDERKQRFGVAAYLFSIRDALAAHRSFECELACDGETERRRLLQIAIGNGRHYGGGLTVSEDAAIDDGALDLYAVPPLPWWRILLLLPRLRFGPRANDRGILLRRGREIEVRTSRPLSIDTDGEITRSTPARFRVLPGALEVFVPANYAGPGLSQAMN